MLLGSSSCDCLPSRSLLDPFELTVILLSIRTALSDTFPSPSSSDVTSLTEFSSSDNLTPMTERNIALRFFVTATVTPQD